MNPQNEQGQRAEAVLRAVDESDAQEIHDEAGEVERQSQQVESAFDRARQRKGAPDPAV